MLTADLVNVLQRHHHGQWVVEEAHPLTTAGSLALAAAPTVYTAETGGRTAGHLGYADRSYDPGAKSTTGPAGYQLNAPMYLRHYWR